jgi:hypothetical protein
VPERPASVARMTRRMLVVATAPHPSDELLERVSRAAGDDVEVAVVAPVSDLSPLQWLADDSRSAREAAEQRARAAAEAGASVAKVVEARVGDPDPVTAVEDALLLFPADELVVITRPKDTATWLEKRAIIGELGRFGLPVTHVVDDDAEPTRGAFLGRSGDDVLPFFIRHLVLALLLVTVILVAVAFALYEILR